ncbi:MAG: HAD family phosphatase [Turicibacter sp.]|uniref:Haloacid dehalogenase n=1 Tax=Turicibacter faecis TaxID=2963365 RepID=A0ABN6ZJ47_9FIRM|nr:MULTISPECIES: Cof-type HAD-IIB family hydrolase [unclassified Turicibacter]MCI8700982.1 HAD family phosphatase [Turicibacter sp.]BEH91960.1 haloacid dehalogenase [Turicibacter sp. TC023]MCU7205434.1 Cof-type HAD-IIB family hydrolase [Turicibacter sp. TA25]MCU7208937.1 Cof-type HAD-IIB family hydrolase [Turicibacter sp. 1E2]NCE78957.1 HAD family phosphatase [Turicibacter sp. TS3]
MSNYKMIVLDLDGTLMSSKNEISPKTKEALLKAQEQGVMIVLASGRPTYGMTKAAKELRLDQYPGYILSYNGGRIIESHSNEMIYDKSLTPEICHELYDLAREMNVNIMAYEDAAIVTADNDQYIQKEANINGMPINRVENFKDSVTFNSVKCLCTADPEYLEKVEIKMKERLGERLSITRSLPFFLEFMPQNINKAYSLQKLLDHVGLDQSQLIACGDGYNDLSMIDFAGLGVAMGNAVSEVKKAANYITSTNDEDGIAHVIEKFIFTA